MEYYLHVQYIIIYGILSVCIEHIIYGILSACIEHIIYGILSVCTVHYNLWNTICMYSTL